MYAVDDASAKIATQEPGPSCMAIAELVGLWPRGAIEVATTNYDFLLESAVRAQAQKNGDLFGDHQDPPVVDALPGEDGPQIQQDGTLLVRHIHGALDRKTSKYDMKPAVLGEAEYYLVQKEDSWQSKWLTGRLTKARCLFIGASMTDANVLRFLKLAGATGSKHFALIMRRPSAVPVLADAQDLWEQATSARWGAFGIEALYPHYYADVAAFLDELGRRRRRRNIAKKPLASDRLPRRLTKWHSKISKSLLPVDGPRFSKAQDKITSLLSAGPQEARALIADTPGVADCRFGLQLWTVNARGDELVLWGSNQMPGEIQRRWHR